MIDSKFHVELGGKKYTLAEGDEGAHYQRKREPLRAPSNGYVAGEINRFNLRPDILEWALTDWSGGEGQLIFDGAAENANKYLIGYNIDPFAQYGTLRLSPDWEETQLSSGGPMASSLWMARAADVLLGAPRGVADTIYQWDPTTDTWDVFTDASINTASTPIGTGTYLYYIEGGSLDVNRVNATTPGAATQWNTDANPFRIAGPIRSYLYGLFGAQQEIREMPTTGTPPVASTAIYTITDRLTTNDPVFAPGKNRLYLATLYENDGSILHQIVPTIGSAPGFGLEVARFSGFRISGLFYLLGFVYMLGKMGDKLVVMYFDETQDSFGVITDFAGQRPAATIAPFFGRDIGPDNGSYVGRGFQAKFILHGGATGNEDEWQIMTLDAITGGIAGGTVILWDVSAGGTGNVLVPQVAEFENDVFASFDRVSSSAPRVLRTIGGTYTTQTGRMDSSIYDFGLIDEKILTSITLHTDALPAGNTVAVKYQLDQDGSWLTAGTHTTTGAEESIFNISTGSQTRSFKNLQIRLELTTDSTAETPVVRAVRARAAVVKGVRTWTLILNASDELGEMQNRNWSGETLITNITAAGDANQVVTFKDGYSSRRAGQFTSYDVVIDEYTVVAQPAGEAVIHVSLREVL